MRADWLKHRVSNKQLGCSIRSRFLSRDLSRIEIESE